MYRDCVRRQLFIDAVKLLLQYSLGHHPAETAHQMLQDRKFLTGKLQGCSLDPNITANGVEYRIACLERDTESQARPAQQRLGSRNQLGHREGLDEIVVGARVEAQHAIFHCVARGKDERGDISAGTASLGQHLQAVTIGQTKVENHGIVSNKCERLAGIRCRIDGIDDESCASEGRFQDLNQARLVLDHQQSHRFLAVMETIQRRPAYRAHFITTLSAIGHRHNSVLNNACERPPCNRRIARSRYPDSSIAAECQIGQGDRTMRSLTRREALVLGAGSAATILVGAHGSAQSAPADAAAEIAKFTGGRMAEAGRVTIELPEIAENGNSVPLSVVVNSPMTPDNYVSDILVVAEGNPWPGVATFKLTPMSGRAEIATRIRLAGSQNVVVVARTSNGGLLTAQRQVKVTIGGCGG